MGRIRKLAYWLTIPCGRRGGYAAAAPSLDDGAIKEAWFQRVCEVNADEDRISSTLREPIWYCKGVADCEGHPTDDAVPCDAPCRFDQVNVSTFESGGDDKYIDGKCFTHWWH